jgi:hypothetical protein
MAIPKSQLEDWSHQGSVTQSTTTYATIRRALEAPDTNYADKRIEIFLQGSYGNNTNIYAESDVDVVIRLNSTFHYDLDALTPQESGAFENAYPGSASYGFGDFKTDVIASLQKSFGVEAVKPGNKAIKISANGSRRSADVVVATQFRRYTRFYSSYLGIPSEQYVRGICFFTSSGERIVDYPKQHSENCTTKHQSTQEWFKPMVRILKNMRGRLVENRLLQQGIAPSYFIEGLLYNVPDAMFGQSYGDTFVAAINWIRNADRSKFVCANKLHSLSGDSTTTSWPSANCDLFLNALVKLWKNWA